MSRKRNSMCWSHGTFYRRNERARGRFCAVFKFISALFEMMRLRPNFFSMKASATDFFIARFQILHVRLHPVSPLSRFPPLRNRRRLDLRHAILPQPHPRFPPATSRFEPSKLSPFQVGEVPFNALWFRTVRCGA